MIELLNHPLATGLVCGLRYKLHYFIAEGLPAEAIKQEFLEHANEEQHAEKIASVLADVGQWQNNR